MAWFTRTHTDPELTLLRRRVDLLEQQVAELARFTGIDPHHLPSATDPVSPVVRDLVAEGKLVLAIKTHREQTGLGLAATKQDVDAICHGRL